VQKTGFWIGGFRLNQLEPALRAKDRVKRRFSFRTSTEGRFQGAAIKTQAAVNNYI
jgi:hypothetical protein